MIDFNFEIKTKLYFGKNKENEVGHILKEYGVNRVLIVIGRSSVKKSGLLDKIYHLLDQEKIEYCLLEGIRANPTTELVYEGLKIAKEKKVDFLLAIGGGSVIDTAKSIAAGYYYEGDPFDFNLHKTKPTKALPLGVILTISASGSEMSTSCVIQDDKTGTKSGFNSELVRPVFAIENPELTYSVNKEQTGYGIVDIMMHTLERYFQPSSDNEVADEFALGLLKTTIKAGRIAINNPMDYEARATLMLNSSLSHNGLTNIGKPFMMPVHQMEHVLSGLYPAVAHGAGLAVMFPAWSKYYLEYDIKKFSRLAEVLFDSHIKDEYKNGLNGIECLMQYFKELGMPLYLEDLGISKDAIPSLVQKLTNDGTRVIGHHKKPMDQEVAQKIYELASRKD